MRIVKGNILDATEDYICHQVNCRGVMGSGLALSIKNKYPNVYNSYKRICDMYSAEDLIGKIQKVRISDTQYIINIFGQLNYGRYAVQTDYEALEKALTTINNTFKEKTIAIPYNMGCGLAGGDWSVVYKLINETLKDCKVTLYMLIED